MTIPRQHVFLLTRAQRRKLKELKMRKYPTDEQFFEAVSEAYRSLAADGLIYECGRSWSERTKSYEACWAAVPPNRLTRAQRRKLKELLLAPVPPKDKQS